MYHFVTEMCTYVHISVAKWRILGYLSDALCDLWGGSIRLLGSSPYPEPVVFQWQSSGNPVCLELKPQFTLECHWSKGQCASSGIPVVFQCVPIMQINTGSPLEHHWMLASASVVPVASQCTCDSSGLPMRSVQWYPSVLTESGLEVIKSGHFPACDP